MGDLYLPIQLKWINENEKKYYNYFKNIYKYKVSIEIWVRI